MRAIQNFLQFHSTSCSAKPCELTKAPGRSSNARTQQIQKFSKLCMNAYNKSKGRGMPEN